MTINKSSLLVDVGQGYSLMLGSRGLTSWKTNDRPTNPKKGTFGFNSKTNSLEYYNGDYWLEAPMSGD